MFVFVQNGYIIGLEVKKAPLLCCVIPAVLSPRSRSNLLLLLRAGGYVHHQHRSLIILISGCALRCKKYYVIGFVHYTFYGSGKLAGEYLDSLKLRG